MGPDTLTPGLLTQCREAVGVWDVGLNIDGRPESLLEAIWQIQGAIEEGVADLDDEEFIERVWLGADPNRSVFSWGRVSDHGRELVRGQVASLLSLLHPAPPALVAPVRQGDDLHEILTRPRV